MVITLRQAQSEDFSAICRLCDERYGTGYITRESFDGYLKHPELFTVAYADGEFAGFAVMSPASAEEVAKHMKLSLEEVERLSESKRALIYKSLAVDRRFEKLGMPVSMSSRLLKTVKAQGYGIIFASAWIIDGRMPIGKMFERLEFIPLYERHNLWYDDESYSCVVCGGRCRCDAMLFYRYI